MPLPAVRFARLDDDAALGALDRSVWSPLHAVTPAPQPPYREFFDERHAPRDHLVAEVDGRLAGYVRFGLPTPLVSHAHVRQIRGLAVAHESRGRGVARALLRAAMDEARRQGARRITLRVLAPNTPARCLYESVGFTVEGVLPQEFRCDGEYVDDVLMGRTLV
ncbi:GNAT family N-acetyltransferase [Streptomyces sp. NPDC058045]|uniref:GNAT family N-acetyltransferase n=1 Tax=Streptomyces sp. NPDC058045 TaxID=3346311 RepID=UPI0036EF7C55